jgi:hypothetical protein
MFEYDLSTGKPKAQGRALMIAIIKAAFPDVPFVDQFYREEMARAGEFGNLIKQVTEEIIAERMVSK